MTDDKLQRHLLVVDRRMDGLYDAIRERDWERVEWSFDHVQGSLLKIRREVGMEE